MKSRLLGAVSACATAFVSLTAQAVPVSGQGTWESTLQGRDLDGSPATFEAYYDTTLDITWLADASVNGQMTWDAANTWANNLDVNGVTGWRLPTMVDTGTPGCEGIAYTGTDCGYNVQTGSAATTVYSEMASLFYDTLGNLADFDTSGATQSGSGLSNTGPFSNLWSSYYWSGLEYAPVTSRAWYFRFNNGRQYSFYKTFGGMYALAVRPGDVSTVPVPAAVWLFGSGLMGLLGVMRRKR